MEVISLLLPCGDQAFNSVMKSGFLVLKHTLRPPPPRAPHTHPSLSSIKSPGLLCPGISAVFAEVKAQS